MISFNDILDNGTAFQGPLRVIAVSFEGRFTTVYEGEGDEVPNDETWGEGYVSYVYYDAACKCVTVEIEEDEGWEM